MCSRISAEAKVQTDLAKEFGQTFTEKRLPVGCRWDGTVAYKGFDAVSAEGKVVAMVKNYSASNLVGNQTRKARVMQDLYHLSLVDGAEWRIMYLSRQFYNWFVGQPDAAIASAIKVRTIDP